LDHAYVRDIEDGTHDPTLNTLRMITRCLGVTISELLAVAKRDDGDNHRDRDPDGFVT
jgi:transcriptional regulator with XRE-family HTH domain